VTQVGSKTVQVRVDVMITVFGDFRQFLAKIGVFLKKQRYDEIVA
jgi:hypothetical protein